MAFDQQFGRRDRPGRFGSVGWWTSPFATNANDSYVADVVQLHSGSRNDTVYTANAHQIAQLEGAGYVNEGTAFTAYDEPLRGLDPVWQMVSPRGQHGDGITPRASLLDAARLAAAGRRVLHRQVPQFLMGLPDGAA